MLLQKKEGRVYDKDLDIAEKQIKGFPLLPPKNTSMQMNNDALLVFQNRQSDSLLGTYTFGFGTQGGYPEFTAIIKEGAEEVLRKTLAASTNTSAQISQQLGPTSEGYTLTT